MRLIFRQICLFATIFAATVSVVVAQDAATEPANVSGNWTVSIQGERGARTQKMSIEQDGKNLAGSIQDDRGKEELQGSIEGNKIRFTVSMSTPRGTMTLEYNGKVNGDSMSGTIKNPLGNSASWSAKRKGQ
jgi:D-glucosaminate-6-phosphate ammonia-lyase